MTDDVRKDVASSIEAETTMSPDIIGSTVATRNLDLGKNVTIGMPKV